MPYPIRYDTRCPGCGAEMIKRLAITEGNVKGVAYYKCGAVANVYGIVVGGRG